MPPWAATAAGLADGVISADEAAIMANVLQKFLDVLETAAINSVVAAENPVKHCAVNALSFSPRKLTSRSSYL